MSRRHFHLSHWADRLAFGVLIGGVLLMVQPWWAAGFQVGFWVTLAAIVVVNITSRLVTDEP